MNRVEIWKDIPNYDRLYQVSDFGRVKSLARAVDTKGGAKRNIKERILKINHSGRYSTVDLGHNNTKTVHRLVAITFIENTNNLNQVNHIDGDKRNNNVHNLEWCTQSENQKHAYNIGLQKPFSIGGKTVEVCVKEEGKFLNSYKSVKQCAEELGLRCGSVHRVLSGKRKHYHGLSFERL